MACKQKEQNRTQVEIIGKGRCTGNNQKSGHEEKHGLEHRTAVKLEMKGTYNIMEGPGQTGRNKLREKKEGRGGELRGKKR